MKVWLVRIFSKILRKIYGKLFELLVVEFWSRISEMIWIFFLKYLKSIVSVKIEIASVHQGSFQLVFIKLHHYLSLRYFSRTLDAHVMKTFLTRSERCWASSLQLGFLTKMSFVWNFKFRSADNWIEMSQNSNCIKMQNDLNRIENWKTREPTNQLIDRLNKSHRRFRCNRIRSI